MRKPPAGPLVGRRFLVTDGEQRSALAVVRSLGTAGGHVIVGSQSGRSLAGASKHCRLELRLPAPLGSPREFAEAVRSAVVAHDIEILLPISEASLRPVLDGPVDDACILPFPSAATFARASDKRGLTELAAQLGIPVPRQIIFVRREDGFLAHPGLPAFPLILKPAVSVARGDAGQAKLTVGHVDHPGALLATLRSLPDEAFPLLVQERIVGPGVGLFLLRWQGRIVARFAHRRLREKPPSGGVSVYRKSIVPPPEALAFAELLLQALDWTGVAMVEFKQDARTGVPYLMEINGRFWGSLQLAVDAGVDFPRLLAEAALGQVPQQMAEGRPGVRSRWLLGDVDHTLLRLSRTRAELNLGSEEPGRLSVLGNFLLPWRPGDRFEVLRMSDPCPFVRELAQWLAELARA